uniref:Large polyvalent protein associated domain-containing protein n=1 Tax=viral metagenome TaxID=1070528 RepID=A0A6M3L5H8_9ZZZZ
MAVKELNNFRKKYPQYNDYSDVELAERLANKYPEYSDLVDKIPKTKLKIPLELQAIAATAKIAYDKFKNLPPIKKGDEIVENVSRFIEPEVPAGRTTLGLMTKDLPRQVIADFTRGYKPSTLLPFIAGAKLAKPVIKPIAGFIGKKIPTNIKKFFLKEFTVGKGMPQQFQEMLRKGKLEKAAGARESEEVAKILSIAPHDMQFKLPESKGGQLITIKKGQPITREHQKYIGRIFRKEIDLGGKQSRFGESPELSRRIAKNVEVEIGFNKKIQSIQNKLNAVNKTLRDKELMAEGLVGQKFKTQTGFIEKVAGTTKTPSQKPLPGGEFITKNLQDVITEPVAPTSGPIPSGLFPGEDIARSLKQVSKAPGMRKAITLSRKDLFAKRKFLSKQLMKETIKIEEGVRANYYIFDRRFSEQIRTHPKYQELSSIANEGRDVMDKWSRALVNSGIPKEEASDVINANIGEYMARMFEKNLIKGKSGFSTKNMRLRLQGLKHRKDLSHEVLKQMLDVKEPAIPTAIRVKQISSSISNNKIFQAVANNPEWTANTNITGKMIQLSKGPSLGPLSGKFVVPEIAAEVNAITSLKTQNLALEIYGKALSAWKYGKVVMNPATHARNMISNSILLDLSGVNHFRQLQLFPRVVKDYLSKGKLYQLALRNGGIGDEFLGGEVDLVGKYYTAGKGGNLEKWMNVLKAPFRAFGKMYQAEEQLAKMVKFADIYEKTGNASLAALESQKWLFNYTEIPNVIKVAKHVTPFITFTYKALPRIAESIVNNPLRVYKYYAFARGFNEASRKMLNMTPSEFARSEKALPPWLMRNIGGMPTNILMPWKDKYGRTQWLNLEYMLPVGMAPEIMQRGLLRGAMSNPIYSLVSDLEKNKDFTGKDIVPTESTKEEAAKIMLNYAYRQLAPSLAPGIIDNATGESILKGGYSFEKIMDAVYKRPDYEERTKNMTSVLFDVLAGFKITSLDIDESENFKVFDIKERLKDLKKQLRDLDHPAISEKTRERETEKIFKKQDKVLEELP